MRAFKVGDRVRGPHGKGVVEAPGPFDSVVVNYENYHRRVLVHSSEIALDIPDPATSTDEEWNYDPRQEVIIIGTPDAIRKLFA